MYENCPKYQHTINRYNQNYIFTQWTLKGHGHCVRWSFWKWIYLQWTYMYNEHAFLWTYFVMDYLYKKWIFVCGYISLEAKNLFFSWVTQNKERKKFRLGMGITFIFILTVSCINVQLVYKKFEPDKMSINLL